LSARAAQLTPSCTAAPAPQTASSLEIPAIEAWALSLQWGACVNARRLLIIDEVRGDAAALARILSREGYATRRVSNAAEAMRDLGAARGPELVLWSAAAADAGWSQALSHLKARVAPAFLPVVLVSPHGSVEARVAGLRAGADDVVGKPGSSEEILARVAALLRIKAAHDVLAQAKIELERQSITDPLTGLFNRRYFQYRLEQEAERASRYGDPVSLLMLDLDHFKDVNDRYGHGGGDLALRCVANVLSQELRRLDVCTRWGGEEFGIIMPNTPVAGAAAVAKRILRAIRAKASLELAPLASPSARPELLRVTASLGLASFPCAETDRADLLVQRADTAVYRAKAEGRNRICVASPDGVAAGRPVAALTRAAATP
jgi:diguanylate cyclase (GGDEF)-like protein